MNDDRWWWKKEKKEEKRLKLIERTLNFTEKGSFDKGFDEFSDGSCTICLEPMEKGIAIRRVI